ncbi:MAG: hypothetical protein ACERIH_09425, partial [Labilibaculum antarcticum]
FHTRRPSYLRKHPFLISGRELPKGNGINGLCAGCDKSFQCVLSRLGNGLCILQNANTKFFAAWPVRKKKNALK